MIRMTRAEFEKAWGKECAEWEEIHAELAAKAQPEGRSVVLYVSDVTREQHQRMRARGETPMDINEIEFVEET